MKRAGKHWADRTEEGKERLRIKLDVGEIEREATEWLDKHYVYGVRHIDTYTREHPGRSCTPTVRSSEDVVNRRSLGQESPQPALETTLQFRVTG